MPVIYRAAEDTTGKEERRMTCSKGMQTGVEPMAAAEDSQPQYKRQMLHQLSYQTTFELISLCVLLSLSIHFNLQRGCFQQ